MAFATDAATHVYYERRAAEYDDWWNATGLFASRERPGWSGEVGAVVHLVRDLSPARTLDVACGTGFLTRHLPGPLVVGGAFERLFTGHFYGHLEPGERAAFLREARRVAGELLVVDSALRDGIEPEQWQERTLNDGSRHRVFKRFLTADGLAAEIGGEPLLSGTWFVAARA